MLSESILREIEMVNSVTGGSSAGLLSAVMKGAADKQNLEVAVLKKSQDLQKMQGESALKLIDSAGAAAPSNSVDVRV